ncbi:MAG: glutamate racemase [Lachnospiraceae bacterium]|nr:glutamate racemase [Lachnospiraceae bacterium]
MKASDPIVVFDSGLGGISVLKKLVAVMPNENYLYFGDSANAPYGPRTTERIQKLTVEAIRSLLPDHPKAVVIACNTATAAALGNVEALCPDIPVIGIRPAVLRAEAAGCRRILSLATASTLASASYQAQLKDLKPETEVVSVACPGIVSYVESLKKDPTHFLHYLRELLLPVFEKPVDGVVLGCTHFPFAKQELCEALDRELTFFDASIEVAQKVKEILTVKDWRNLDQRSGSITFINSLCSQDMLAFSWSLLALDC